MNIDIFNGDADGICALHQLRLVNPIDSLLVTGLKREINLLANVSAHHDDFITVLDISLDQNREDLQRILKAGARVIYFDHHHAGEIPEHPNLEAKIDTNPGVCTSLLVNEYLQGKYPLWAVTAAFGDNLFDSACKVAAELNLNEKNLDSLKRLGICINYNGYGGSIDDLFFHPADLYKKIKAYKNPLDFISNDEAFAILLTGYEEDLAKANKLVPELELPKVAVYMLPNEKWARRVSGIFGNELARKSPVRAHAVITDKGKGTYQVSVRAPLDTKTGADTLCRQFDTGGGRRAAAGINVLPESDLARFIKAFQSQFNQ